MLLGERGRTADAVDALRAGQRDGYDAFGKDLLGRLRRDRLEIRDVDDRGERRDGERARRIEMRAGVLLIGGVPVVTGMAVAAARSTLWTIGAWSGQNASCRPSASAVQHETDRQKCTRHQ